MSTVTPSFLLVFLLGSFATLETLGASGEPLRKSALLLFPYHYHLPNHQIAAQALGEEFSDVDDLAIELSYEFLDLNRFPDSTYLEQRFDLLETKYRAKHIDLVMVQTDILLDLWLAKRNEILPDTPIVYYDTNSAVIVPEEMPPDVAGVSGIVDFTRSIEWILRARPSINEIVLVYGTTPSDWEYTQSVDTLKQAAGEHARITDLSGLSLAEIQQRVAALPSSSVVLYELMFEDATGVKYRPIDVLRALIEVSPVPVISGYDQFIGTGTIGGYMYSVDQQAREAVQIGLRVLRGERVGSIPTIKYESNQFMFDHLALQRFEIPLSLLPQNSVIKNRQYSFWELYRARILAVFSIITVLLVLVVFLLVEARQLSRTRLALANLNIDLEKRVDDRTAMLHETNDRLREEITERKRLEEKLKRQATSDELTGVPNRRHFLNLLQNEVKRALRLNHPLVIACIDIDNFKNINDTYGHAAGDQALVTFTKLCRQKIREIDVLARLGGDEFLILMPDTTLDHGHEVVERVRLAVSAAPIDLHGRPVSISVTVGISDLANEPGASDALLARADDALYRGKEAGRNRVVVVEA